MSNRTLSVLLDGSDEEVLSNELEMVTHQKSLLDAKVTYLETDNEKLRRHLAISISAKQSAIEQVRELTLIVDSFEKWFDAEQTSLADSVEYLLYKRNRKKWSKTICAELADCICSDSIYAGILEPILKQKMKPIIREENPLDNAMALARKMDLSGVTLNFEALHALWGMEQQQVVVGGENKKILHHGFICHPKKVSAAMRSVNAAAQASIPFAHKWLDGGVECVQFDYEKLLTYSLKVFGLYDRAKQVSVMISPTLDGADISRNIQHVTAGVKFNDPNTIDPTSGLPIGLQDQSCPVQSPELCTVWSMYLAKDNKHLYDTAFSDFFAFFRRISTEECFGFKKFNVASPQDTSSRWKVMGKGGACKVSDNFCFICSCRKKTLLTPRVERCVRCIRLDCEFCYHWPEGSSENKATFEEEMELIWSDEANRKILVVDKTKLKLRYATDEVGKNDDMSNVEYIPRTTRDKQEFLSSYLDEDVVLLGHSRTLPYSEKLSKVKTGLRLIARCEELKDDIGACTFAQAKLDLKMCIPCGMHFENRTAEKIIKMLLLEGMKCRDGNGRIQEEMLTQFEYVVNSEILGEPHRMSNWRIAKSKGKEMRNAISDQTMPNAHARKFIDKIHCLTSVCVEDNDRRTKWNQTVEKYKLVRNMAGKHEDFTDDDIEEFQDLADSFFLAWINLVGRDGLTNYFHELGSGHFAYYLREWRNLYRFSQQGWEHLNKVIKMFYFRRTQRGGNGGKKGERNSKLVPIAKWLQRKLYFLSGDVLPDK